MITKLMSVQATYWQRHNTCADNDTLHTTLPVKFKFMSRVREPYKLAVCDALEHQIHSLLCAPLSVDVGTKEDPLYAAAAASTSSKAGRRHHVVLMRDNDLRSKTTQRTNTSRQPWSTHLSARLIGTSHALTAAQREARARGAHW